MSNIILASSSPRRVQLLREMGYEFSCVSPDIDETRNPLEKAGDYCIRLAREKATVVAKNNPASIVIGADTIVVQGDSILGKPKDKEQFLKFISLLSGKNHRVMTAVSVSYNEVMHSFCTVTEVQMRHITAEEALVYWATGEPKDKAGGYAIQGIGGQFVKSISGSCSNVIGLPQAELYALLSQIGATSV